jgi:hypothetical protein
MYVVSNYNKVLEHDELKVPRSASLLEESVIKRGSSFKVHAFIF